MKKFSFKIPKINLKIKGKKEKKSKAKKKSLLSFSFKKSSNKVIALIHDNMYIYDNGKVIKEEIHSTNGIITSAISFKDVINISFKLSKALSEDELIIEAEKYVYEQNILDFSKEYKIIYNFQQYEEFYYVDAFAIEVEKLKELMGNYLSTFKYIDFISFAPFCFEEFYDITNTPPMVDIFVYFNRDDSYVVGFRGGKFVFIRALDKLSILERELNKSSEEIIELLKVKGVDRNRYSDDYTYEIIDTFFSKLFAKINNIVNYSVNFFKLDRVNRIYFYSPFEINGLIENYRDFWNLSKIEFKKYTVLTEYDPFEYTLTLYNAKNYNNENLNFSVFKRPPPFYKRESGKFVLGISAAIVLISADAYYKYYTLKKLEEQKAMIERQASTYKNRLKRIKNEIKMYEESIKKKKEEYSKLKSQIDNMYNKIVKLYKVYNKPVFTNQYAKILYLLEKYNLKVSEFHKIKDNYDIVILASQIDYDNIPLFLQDLKAKGFKNIDIFGIENNSTSYKAKVSFNE